MPQHNRHKPSIKRAIATSQSKAERSAMTAKELQAINRHLQAACDKKDRRIAELEHKLMLLNAELNRQAKSAQAIEWIDDEQTEISKCRVRVMERMPRDRPVACGRKGA